MMHRWMAVGLLAGTALGCSGPQTGTWRGTAEVAGRTGAVGTAIWSVQLHCGTDREGIESCRVDLQPPGEALQQLSACSFERKRRSAELTVDPGKPGCDGPAADRLHLVGTVGEGVWFGNVVRAGNTIGRFRAYLAR